MPLRVDARAAGPRRCGSGSGGSTSGAWPSTCSTATTRSIRRSTAASRRKLYGGDGETRLHAGDRARHRRLARAAGARHRRPTSATSTKATRRSPRSSARAHVHADAQHCDFFTALWATRAGNVFTTHTPVAAAFDTFALPLLLKYGARLRAARRHHAAAAAGTGPAQSATTRRAVQHGLSRGAHLRLASTA